MDQALSAMWMETLTHIIPTLALTAALGQCLSRCYEWSYEGLSYSRRFVNSLTLSTLTSCALMMAISAHAMLGLGLFGAMAMVRYRVNARDLWEMSFIFSSLVTGLCVGVGMRTLAVAFCLSFCLVAYILAKAGIGATLRFDGVIRFWLPAHPRAARDAQIDPTDPASSSVRTERDAVAVEDVLRRYCANYLLIALREGAQGEGAEISYQIALSGRQRSARRATARAELIEALRVELRAEEITLMSQDHHLEL